MVGSEHAAASKMDAVASARAGCCSIQFECRGIQRLTDTLVGIVSARTLKNCHLILEKDFKVIPLEEVP